MQINRAAQAIAQAEKPVIYAGGGVVISGAQQLLLELAEKANIPVTTTLMGLGGFPALILYHGYAGHARYYANMAVHESDLIIAVGARFDDRVTGKLSHLPARQNYPY